MHRKLQKVKLHRTKYNHVNKKYRYMFIKSKKTVKR